MRKLSAILTIAILSAFSCFAGVQSNPSAVSSPAASSTPAAAPRQVIDLNGTWSFDQTEQAFPPKKFTRTIPVPGLVHMARPKISQYDKFFRSDHEVESVSQFNFLERDYTPMYNWYSRKVRIGEDLKGRKLILNIRKSQYVTMVYVNGFLAGRAIECCTPIEFNITDFVKFGQDNDILIMVGDRAWLPSEVAGQTDKEKIQYLPGIWDDVYITATGELCVDKALFLPSLEKQQVTVKTLIKNMNPPQMLYGAPTTDEFSMTIRIREKLSGKTVATKTIEGTSIRDNNTAFETTLDVPEPHAWSPEDPFLYTGEIELRMEKAPEEGTASEGTSTEGATAGSITTDAYSHSFGIRDFCARGRFFYLNGQKYYLRGTNITLQRFFEDPDCGDLAWNREWVRKLLIDNPKSVDWNAMRICVGIAPDFWYDLCDEYGIILQNEWLYWQNHGWNDQIRKEYTSWVWSDGNHPSIVIWDAINENWDSFIGNTLIPELKQLDPTRVWDAGYMKDCSDEMDEPHTYRNVPSGRLDDWTGFEYVLEAGVPQLINEYSWMWLWRDGRPSKLTVNIYNDYLGKDATPDQRRQLQAYCLQMDTEWLRSERSVAGVLSFCTLTNNYGFTGDWYIGDIKDLQKGPAYSWFRHCFAPAAVFLDLADGRYAKDPEGEGSHADGGYAKDGSCLIPGKNLPVVMVGVNDRSKPATGKLVLKIYDKVGKATTAFQQDIEIPEFGRLNIPAVVKVPDVPGGYLFTAEFTPDGADDGAAGLESATAKIYISRRFLKVGLCDHYDYFEIEP